MSHKSVELFKHVSYEMKWPHFLGAKYTIFRCSGVCTTWLLDTCPLSADLSLAFLVADNTCVQLTAITWTSLVFDRLHTVDVHLLFLLLLLLLLSASLYFSKRGTYWQVSRSFPCSTSLHIASPKELEAVSRSSKTHLAKNGGGRSAPI